MINNIVSWYLDYELILICIIELICTFIFIFCDKYVIAEYRKENIKYFLQTNFYLFVLLLIYVVIYFSEI